VAVGSDSAALNLNDPGEGPHCPIARPSLETIRRPRAYIFLPTLQRGNFFYDLRHTGGLRLVPPCLPYVLPGFGHGLGASAAAGRQQCGQRNAFGNDGTSRSAAFPPTSAWKRPPTLTWREYRPARELAATPISRAAIGLSCGTSYA